MIEELEPYPAYKDSGVEWLGKVPEGWEATSLGRRYAVQLGKMLDTKKITGAHLFPYLRNVDVRWDEIRTNELPQMDIASCEQDRYTVQRGDLLICEGGEVGRAAIWDQDSSVGFQKALHRARPRDSKRDFSRYLYYCMSHYATSGIFEADGSENTFAHLTSEKLRRHKFPFPRAAEQAAIVRYLDHVDSRIQRFIDAKERLIELLEEEKQAIIHRAVTRGLDPDVPLKPSGVDWLGDVPGHWEIRRLRSTTESTLGGVWGADPGAQSGTELGCVRVADFDRQVGVVRTGPLTLRSFSASEVSGRELKPGDLVLEKSGGGDKQTVGAVVRYDRDDRALYSNFTARLPVAKGHDSHYLGFLHRTLYMRGVNVRSIKQTTGIQNLDVDSYLSELVPVPPPQEQVSIGRSTESFVARISAANHSIQHESRLAREFRTRLISDVVTGKLDVRAAAERLPPEAGFDDAQLDERIEEVAAA